MGELYLSAPQICAAVGIEDHDWRTLRRVFRAKIETIKPRRTTMGKTPTMFSLADVIAFLEPLPQLLSTRAELEMREVATPQF